MATEGGGATQLNGPHSAALSAGEPVVLPILLAVGAEDGGDLEAARPARRQRGRRGQHGLVLGPGQIQG
jgi:hypothetical protein